MKGPILDHDIALGPFCLSRYGYYQELVQ